LASFLSVLDDRFLYIPLDVIVPGILEAGTPGHRRRDRAEAGSGSSVVDGRNRR